MAVNFSLSFSLNFLSIFVHTCISGSIWPTTLIWLLLVRSFPPAQGSYTFSGQNFKDFSRTFQDPTWKFQGLFFIMTISPQNHLCFRGLLIDLKIFFVFFVLLAFHVLTKADFPITLRSMLFLQAKQNALFEFVVFSKP